MDNTPLSPWGYLIRQVIYSIPVVGVIILIIHAIGARNVNARNFARSYFCVIILCIIFGVIAAVTGLGEGLLDILSQM